jgi:hypothetical protein
VTWVLTLIQGQGISLLVPFTKWEVRAGQEKGLYIESNWIGKSIAKGTMYEKPYTMTIDKNI